ncbi:hypothetical protein ACIBCM_33355 [Streptomyces sp. NPDC051018]|uniref:hypothetical protein n=1 Tax=Streptomyces sp. NPDC051018 TaxID=3365639 RepID=UPI0037A8C027
MMGSANETESAVLRRAVAALSTFAGEGFRPSDTRSTRFLGGEGEVMTVFLTHPAHPALSSSIEVGLGDFEPDGSGEIYLTIHLDEPEDELEREWEMALTLTSQLVAGLRPSLVHLTAWHLDGYGQIYPSTHFLPGSGLPAEFGPWTYVSGEELTDRLRGRLASLPAFASHPLGDGWLVRAVEHPGDEPTKPFRDALNTLNREPIVYRSTRLAVG